MRVAGGKPRYYALCWRILDAVCPSVLGASEAGSVSVSAASSLRARAQRSPTLNCALFPQCCAAAIYDSRGARDARRVVLFQLHRDRVSSATFADSGLAAEPSRTPTCRFAAGARMPPAYVYSQQNRAPPLTPFSHSLSHCCMSPSTYPPSYTPSPAPPRYSAVPRPELGEVCLTRTARAHAHAHRDTRVLVRDHESKSCPFSTAFLHQPDDAEVPTYARGDALDGFVTLHHTAGVLGVSVKVRRLTSWCSLSHADRGSGCTLQLLGQTQLSLGAGGKHTFPFLEQTFELWRQEGQDSIPPDHLAFVLPLPTHVDDDGAERALPSTSRADFQGAFAIVEYTFKVTVTTKGLGGVFKKSHR